MLCPDEIGLAFHWAGISLGRHVLYVLSVKNVLAFKGSGSSNSETKYYPFGLCNYVVYYNK